MRRVPVVILCGALAACRTSDLGSCASDADCSGNGFCDSAQHVCVQTDAPRIAAVTVTTPAAYTAPDGKLYFDTAGAPLAVSATVTSRSGAAVDPTSVCLRTTAETGPCAHPGSAGAANAFTFTLPRLPGPADGTPLAFTVSAASVSGHASSSAAQQVYFDDQPPGVSIAADPNVYARTLPDGGAAAVNVSATIGDGSGVASAQLLSAGKSVPPSSVTGGTYLFQLDPRDAPAGVEGAYAFQIAAQDNVGHSVQAGGSRKIDDAPPEISVQIYKSGDVPDGGGVTYPAAVANTGWTGATFVYSDTVHVAGTITDLSGVSSATLRLDGIDIDGGVATGAARSLGCQAGTTSCPFALDVTLNDAGVPFHTGAATFDAGTAVGLIPAGNLQLTISAQDSATAFDGTASPNAGTSASAARTTRLLWNATLSGAAVSGLAVHPSGDVVVTMDGGTGDTVYDLAPDQRATRWSFGSGASRTVGGVFGTPAIGVGDGGTARIYVASSAGNLHAVEADGGEAWTAVTASTLFVVGPAVTEVTISSNIVDQVVVPDGVGATPRLWRATSGSDFASVASDNRDFHSAPMILGSAVFYGTQSAGGGTDHLTRHSIGSDGTLDPMGSPAITDLTNPGVPYFGLVTDGTNVYAATRPATGGGIIVKLDTSLTRPALWSSNLASGLAGEPTFGIDGSLYGANLSSVLSTISPADATLTTFVTLSAVGMTPLQGSDGHVYVPERAITGRPGYLAAYEGNQLSWAFASPGAMLRYATMDCRGRLFAASGATVYAFVSDDHGLADTAWPTLRRDARNTGNAGAAKYGIRTASGCDP